MKVARRHFAQFGFQGASLTEIARESGVANSLINYYFEDKQGLFTRCLEDAFSGMVEFIERTMIEPKSLAELEVRLGIFVEEMVQSYLREPFHFEIIPREIANGNAEIESFFRRTMLPIFESVVRFFDLAQKNKLIRADLDTKLIARLLFSSTCDSIHRDDFNKKFIGFSIQNKTDRSQLVQHIVSLFIRGTQK